MQDIWKQLEVLLQPRDGISAVQQQLEQAIDLPPAGPHGADAAADQHF